MNKTLKEAISQLNNKSLWTYFYHLTQIPRESGNEEGIRNYLISVAKENNFEYAVDKTGNVIIKVKATKGYENLPLLAFQGHMDMVCVKDEGVKHNFDTDPLNVVVDGDWIKAVGTTLGADNGIAIALILDLFTDKEAVHGPLEAIITVSEETGLEGAFGLDPTLVDSRLMVNLDSDTEGVIYIGCAGGVETRAIFNLTKESLKDGFNGFELIVDGLLGGHSGAEIHKQRANAITLNARILDAISIVSTTYLQSIEGGTKRNVIPSYCKSTIAIASNNLKEAAEAVEKLTKELKKEYADSDPALNVSFKLVKLTNR